MNALYNHAVKQKGQLQKDLNRFEKNPQTAPISLQGSISATLVSFEKTINQYSDYLNNQPILNDQEDNINKEKNLSRLVSLREELDRFQISFKDLKKLYNEANSTKNQRNQLFGSTTTSENPYNDMDTVMSQRKTTSSISTHEQQQQNSNRSYLDGLQNENSVFQRGNSQLDYILEMGQNSLNDIIEQNHILDTVQDKLTKSLRTLNVSEGTIQSVNSRLFKDKLIFWVGLFLMFLGMYLVLKWLR
ncbi:similar to Saccharomyces cerevisiae YLR078C BOS1 v-SNARE (vesicle specific SNAP receptor) [Maudiozyma saulgeensis]|uniref:Protein transport protein BOS1 n=1 Tax=Maudiozyma saulgeensis TaxID=1789683 RepID=A0A1X7R3L2_9SACH|nr:similar to Saccharomyces cerevisiae YLR078C BOS1 v-SNARE (vesicle specific SNAP receptor) [Kazachstania saulgeensis]